MKLKHDLLKVLIAVVVFVTASFFIYSAHSPSAWKNFTKDFSLNNPMYVAKDTGGMFYVIDSGGRRVVIFNREGRVGRILYADSRMDGGFRRATSLCAGGGYLFLVNAVDVPGKAGIQREEILRYTASGSFDKVLYSRAYDKGDFPSGGGRFRSPVIEGKSLKFYYTCDDSIDLVRVDTGTGAASTESILSGVNSGLMVQSIHADENGVSYIKKTGEIMSRKKDQREQMVYAPGKTIWNINYFPCNLAIIEEGSIIFCEPEKRTAHKFIDTGEVSDWITSTDLEKLDVDYTGNRLAGSNVFADGTIALIIGGTIVYREAGGYDTYDRGSLELERAIVLKCYALWLAALASLLSFIAVMSFIVKKSAAAGVVIKQSAVYTPVVATCIAACAFPIVREFSASMEKEMSFRLNMLLDAAAGAITGDMVDPIEGPADYLSADFVKLRKAVRAFAGNDRANRGPGYYIRITKNDGKWERLVIDSEDSGYPGAPLRIAEGEGSREGNVDAAVSWDDSPGRWGWAIRGSRAITGAGGRVVAIMEIGIDLNDYLSFKKQLYYRIARYSGFSALLVILIVLALYRFMPGPALKQNTGQ